MRAKAAAVQAARAQKAAAEKAAQASTTLEALAAQVTLHTFTPFRNAQALVVMNTHRFLLLFRG